MSEETQKGDQMEHNQENAEGKDTARSQYCRMIRKKWLQPHNEYLNFTSVEGFDMKRRYDGERNVDGHIYSVVFCYLMSNYSLKIGLKL